MLFPDFSFTSEIEVVFLLLCLFFVFPFRVNGNANHYEELDQRRYKACARGIAFVLGAEFEELRLAEDDEAHGDLWDDKFIKYIKEDAEKADALATIE